MSIDKYFDRVYDPVKYNCAHFVCEAWDEVTGVPMGDRLASFLLPRAERHATLPLRHRFRKLGAPVSPCLAVFSAPRRAPHVGIYRNGRILHLTKAGVQFQPPKIVMFTEFQRVEYYDVKNDNPDFELA